MKSIILAADSGTRLDPLTREGAKSLLPIRGKPIIEHIANKVTALDGIDEIIIVSNSRYFEQFEDWLKSYACGIPVKLIGDGSLSHRGRLGAIKDLALVIKKENINDDVLVIGGDNIFSFSLTGFISFASSIKPAPVVGVYNMASAGLRIKKFGVVSFDDIGRVVEFYEKPAQLNGSRFVSLCLYFFPKDTLDMVDQYTASCHKHGAIGDYIKWLSKNTATYAYKFEGDWLDVGDIDAYAEAVCIF